MDVRMNLVPEEYKPRPPVSMRTVCLVVLVLGLAFGCYQLYSMKADKEAEAAALEDRIEAIQQQAMSLSSNPEAGQLNKDIKARQGEVDTLTAMANDFDQFNESVVEWGEVVDSIMDDVPSGVELDSIQSSSDGVQVGGVASTYERVAAYVTALENDNLFHNVTTSQWDVQAGTFKLTMQVTIGGEL